jgi:hypothetical protein
MKFGIHKRPKRSRKFGESVVPATEFRQETFKREKRRVHGSEKEMKRGAFGAVGARVVVRRQPLVFGGLVLGM